MNTTKHADFQSILVTKSGDQTRTHSHEHVHENVLVHAEKMGGALVRASCLVERPVKERSWCVYGSLRTSKDPRQEEADN